MYKKIKAFASLPGLLWREASLRLDIRLSHAPVRDGAAKGKIERFFRGFRDRFLVTHQSFDSLEQLNDLAQEWIENQYNNQPHSSIQMKPLDRFNLDHSRIDYLVNNEFTEEVFFVEEDRKVSAVNVFSINTLKDNKVYLFCFCHRKTTEISL